MTMRLTAILVALVLPAVGLAQPVDPGARPEAITAKLERYFDISGYYRVRFDLMDNHDLNHGPTPSTSPRPPPRDATH